jgi:hypothetical protein
MHIATMVMAYTTPVMITVNDAPTTSADLMMPQVISSVPNPTLNIMNGILIFLRPGYTVNDAVVIASTQYRLINNDATIVMG